MFASVKQCWNLGVTAVGATIYFGSDEATRQIQEVSKAFEMAHELGMDPYHLVVLSPESCL